MIPDRDYPLLPSQTASEANDENANDEKPLHSRPSGTNSWAPCTAIVVGRRETLVQHAPASEKRGDCCVFVARVHKKAPPNQFSLARPRFSTGRALQSSGQSAELLAEVCINARFQKTQLLAACCVRLARQDEDACTSFHRQRMEFVRLGSG